MERLALVVSAARARRPPMRRARRRKGFVVRTPDNVDVRSIRKQLGLSQSEFAARYGFSLGNMQNWEQGHRKAAGAARVLLTVIKNEPKAVDRALRNL